MKDQKGITLVALVVTIIVLLILAGVTIAMVIGSDGIFGKAQTAADTTKEKSALEVVKLAVADELTKYTADKYAGDGATAFTAQDILNQIQKNYDGATVDDAELAYVPDAEESEQKKATFTVDGQSIEVNMTTLVSTKK